MTKTLLIRLEAPIQTWGNSTGNKHRTTAMRPTKSALVGLLANAQGRDYNDDVDDIAACTYAVRADRPGHLERDYRTAGGGSYPALPRDRHHGLAADKPAWLHRPQTANLPVKNVAADKPAPIAGATPPAGKANPKQIDDTYLVDASFLAAFTGDDTLIDQLAHALKHPARALFLGRKAQPPAAPLFAGITNHTDPVDALSTDGEDNTSPRRIWYTTTADNADSTVIYDQPVRFGAQPQRTARVEATTTTGDSTQLSDFF